MPVKASSIESGMAEATISPAADVAEEGEEHGDHEQAAFEQVRLRRCGSRGRTRSARS